MKKLGTGFKQVVIGVIGGLIVTTIINALAENGTIAHDFVTIFALVSLVGNIVSINSMRRWGIFYTVGWFFGSWIFFNLGMFDTTDTLLHIVLPIAIMALRFALWVRQRVRV